MKSVLGTLTLALVVIGCVGKSGEADRCTTNETRVCNCTSTLEGLQTCLSDGTFSSCVCDGPDAVETDTVEDTSTTTDATATTDATVEEETTASDGGGGDADAVTENGPDPAAAEAITQILVAQESATLERVAVTGFKRPQRSDDTSGFFVQATPTGPALFVEVSPDSLDPVPARGDIVSFSVDAIVRAGDAGGDPPAASAISGYTVHNSGYDISQLVQDVSTTADLVSNIEDYESELVSARFTLKEGPTPAGLNYVSFTVDTAAIQGNASLQLRLPMTLWQHYGLQPGCELDLQQSPMWSFTNLEGATRAQFHIWTQNTDATATNCPDSNLVRAGATSATQVALTFDRAIDTDTLSAGDIVITDTQNANTLSISNVVGSSNQLLVTTGTQAPNADYDVIIGTNVRDILGNPLATNTATFIGYAKPATVVINEIGPNLANRCELAELLVTGAGSMSGWSLWSGDFQLIDFDRLPNLQRSDAIIAHMGYGRVECNGGAPIPDNETDNPAANSGSEAFSGAYDWYNAAGGFIADRDAPLVLRDASGAIVDAVLLMADSNGDVASCAAYITQDGTNEITAEVTTAGQWKDPSGGVPSGGFVNTAFCLNAVPALDTGTDLSGQSIQRTPASDTDSKADWTLSPPTWGQLNTSSP